MRKAFIDFLSSRDSISPEAVENLTSIGRGAPEPIGSIAFKYDLISTADIDIVLEMQRKNRRPFGEIAIELGILTKSQLNALLKVQQMRHAVEIAEALALAGKLDVNEVLAHLGEFLATNVSLQTI